MVDDGAGGAVVAWQDFRTGIDFGIYGQRVSNGGARLWGNNGNPAATGVDLPAGALRATTDDAGGIVLAWHTTDVFAQRLANDGAVASGWPTDGLAISDATDTQLNTSIDVDEASGALIAWVDNRSGNSDIYAQRVSGAGVAPVTVAVGDRTALELVRVEVAPNPVRTITTVHLALPVAAQVSVRVVDIFGRTVATLLENTKVDAGTRRLVWRPTHESAPSGIYLVQASVAGHSITQRVAVIR
jgi:hypothetical protein